MRRLDHIIYEPIGDDSEKDIGGRFAYTMTWLTHVLQDPPPLVPAKVGIGVLMAVLVDGYHDFFTRVFAIILILWALDVVVGSARAFADDKVRFRWTKVIDGLLRLLIICAVAMAVAVVEGVIWELSGADFRGKLLAFTYGSIIVAEFSSIILNVSYFYPVLGGLRAKVIRLIPGAAAKVEAVDAMVIISEAKKPDSPPPEEG